MCSPPARLLDPTTILDSCIAPLGASSWVLAVLSGPQHLYACAYTVYKLMMTLSP